MNGQGLCGTARFANYGPASCGIGLCREGSADLLMATWFDDSSTVLDRISQRCSSPVSSLRREARQCALSLNALGHEHALLSRLHAPAERHAFDGARWLAAEPSHAGVGP